VAAATSSQYCIFETRFGVCGLAWNERGLTRLLLPQSDGGAVERRLRAAAERCEAPPPAIEELIREIQRYFEGAYVDFASAALDLSQVDEFRRSVYRAARAIPFGRTVTYGELARAIGAPQAAQDVGQALGRNPIPLIVPCHRIVASGGKLGGFSAPGGRTTKQRMLALEHAAPADTGRLPGL
jgi:methylated-DNA-[protein]-cysteine S-methyltransferase